MADNKQIAADVLEAVGGPENVSFVTYCMTRLRFTLKDRTVPDQKAIKKISGVLGAQESGGQLQVIIGQNVPKVYDAVCTLGGFSKQAPIDENLDGPKEKLTPQRVGNLVLNFLSGSITPMIPVLLCAGLFQTLAVVVGPDMLNFMSAESDFVVLMGMLYSAAFYFLPVYLGYNAARQIGLTPALGAFMGGILIEPTFVSMATEGLSFSVYGIPCTPGSYAQTIVPILLTIPVMYAIEKFLKKVMPDALATVFTPFLTMAISVPISLCLLAPLGSWIGVGMGAIFTFFGESGGIISAIGCGLLALLWGPLVITGMHVSIIMLGIANFITLGYDSFVFSAVMLSLWGGFGVELAAYVKLRGEEKKRCIGYLIAQYLGGVGEPFIYGVSLRYLRVFVMGCIASGVAGILGGLLGVKAYVAGGSSSFMSLLVFIGGGTQNLVLACVVAAIAFVVGFLLCFFFGFTEDELENGPVGERE